MGSSRMSYRASPEEERPEGLKDERSTSEEEYRRKVKGEGVNERDTNVVTKFSF